MEQQKLKFKTAHVVGEKDLKSLGQMDDCRECCFCEVTVTISQTLLMSLMYICQY